MQFTPENVARILASEKSQTRRRVKDGDSPIQFDGVFWHRVSMRSTHIDAVRRGDLGRIAWEIGTSYAVQPGRGKPAVARILLEQIRYCAAAREISEDDAHAEGFADAAAFCGQYAALNGADALDKACWALAFHLVDDEGEGERDG